MHRAIVWLAAAALLAAACTSPEERLAHHVSRGEAYLRDNEVDAALLEFQSALQVQPENAALYERIGDVLMEYSQLYPKAISYYREAHRIEPARTHAIVREARLLALSDPERARELLDRAVAQEPDSGGVVRAQAFFALVANDLDGALAAADRAVALDPIPPSYAELGAVWLAHIARDIQQKRRPNAEYRSNAIAAYQRVNDLKGGSYHRAILEQARVYGFTHRRSQARKHYLKAIELAEAEGAAETQLATLTAVAYARTIRDLELERHALRALVTVDEDHYDAWEQLARVADRMPRRSGDEILQELTAARPDDARAWLLWSEHLVATDRSRNARTDLRRAIDSGIEEPALYEALIRLEIGVGNLELARTLLEVLERREPDAFATRVASARLALVEGRADEAAETLRRLARKEPNPELLRLLALAHYRRGDLLESRAVLARAMDISPNPSAALLRLSGMVEMGIGNWRGAMDAFIGMIKKHETLTETERVHYALAAYHAGAIEKSREVLKAMVLVEAASPAATIAYAQLFGADDPLVALGGLGLAYKRAPGDPRLVREMTRLEMNLGKTQRALDRLNGLIQRGQGAPVVIFTRANLLASTGAYEQAEADALLAFEADPTLTEAVDLLHTLYRAQGKLETARLAFEEADAAGVLHPGARLLLARLVAEDGETERAQAMLEQVMETNPGMWNAQAELAYLLADEGTDPKRAFDLARSAHIASRRSAETSDVLGYVLLKAGKNGPALQQFRRAIDVASRSGDTPPPSFQYHAGLAYRALGRNEEADEAFRAALGQGEFPEAEEARRQLEAARHHTGDSGNSS